MGGERGVRVEEKRIRGLVCLYYLAKAFKCLEKEGWSIKKEISLLPMNAPFILQTYQHLILAKLPTQGLGLLSSHLQTAEIFTYLDFESGFAYTAATVS